MTLSRTPNRLEGEPSLPPPDRERVDLDEDGVTGVTPLPEEDVDDDVTVSSVGLTLAGVTK